MLKVTELSQDSRPTYGGSACIQLWPLPSPHPDQDSQKGRESPQAEDATSNSLPLVQAWAGPVPATLRITRVVLGMDHWPSPGIYFCPSGNKEVSPCAVTIWGEGKTYDPQPQLTLLPCWEMTPAGKGKAWLSHAAFLSLPSHFPESGFLSQPFFLAAHTLPALSPT